MSFTSFFLDFERSRRGSLWRQFNGRTVSVFRADSGGFKFCVAGSARTAPHWSPGSWPDEQAALVALWRTVTGQGDEAGYPGAGNGVSGGTLRAIETEYNGYRFRSRLEARWAVFLDAVGILYEYEKQGYSLPSGAYLPDFWIPLDRFRGDDPPGSGSWFEIKPVDPSEDELTLLADLTWATGHRGFLIAGNVGPGEYRLFESWRVRSERQLHAAVVTEGNVLLILADREGPRMNEAGEFHQDDVLVCVRKVTDPGALRFPFGAVTRAILDAPEGILRGAYRAARGARFEHGERPRPGRTRPAPGGDHPDRQRG
jgi:hypothetical protein